MVRLRLPVVLLGFMLSLVSVAGAQTKLQLTVHTGRGVNGYDVNSTMISGEKDMLLIDGLGMEFIINDRVNTYFPSNTK